MAEASVGIKAVFDGSAAISGLKGLQRAIDDTTKGAKAQSSVTGGLARVQKSVGGLVNAYTAVAAGALAAGAAAYSMLKEFAAAEMSQNRLKASVQAATGTWSQYAGTLNETIDAGMRKAFDDEEQMDALSRLVQGTQDVAAAQKLLGIAQDVSRGTGKDLTSTAIMLGKVYNGNTGALKRFGIAVKEGMTAEEALAEVQKRYAGQADAYADSTAGRIDKMTVSWANLKEAGGALLASSDGLNSFIDDAADGLNRMAQSGFMAQVKYGELQVAVQNGEMTAKEAEDAYRKLYGTVDQLSESATTATGATKELTAAQEDAANAAYAMEDADIGMERASIRLEQAQKTLKDALKSGDEEKIRDARLGLREATLSAARAGDTLNDSFLDNAIGSGKLADATVPLAQKFTAAADKVEYLKAKLLTVPKSQKAEVKAEIAQAEKNLAKVKAEIKGIQGKTVNIGVNVTTKQVGGTIRAIINGKLSQMTLAKGAIVAPQPGGVTVTMAEAGVPEAAIPMVPTARSRMLLAQTEEAVYPEGRGGTVINITGSRNDAEWILNALKSQFTTLPAPRIA